jgi:hypothetical protein
LFRLQKALQKALQQVRQQVRQRVLLVQRLLVLPPAVE